MHELDKVKSLADLDEAPKYTQELDALKKELEVVRASLCKDFEHLEKDHNLLKGELAKLKKGYDQLHDSH
jgi:hypothetical protein